MIHVVVDRLKVPGSGDDGWASLEVWSREESAETQAGELQRIFSIASGVGVSVSSANCGVHRNPRTVQGFPELKV